MTRVGVISDTHGLLRPEAIAVLERCDRIVHAGDITDIDVLEALGAIAPLTIVRGNNDRGRWADALPVSELVRIEELHLYVVHDIADIEIDPVAAGVAVVVSGHSHKPSIEKRGGVVYFNPGSAGPRRFTLPIAMGELIVDGDRAEPRIIRLER